MSYTVAKCKFPNKPNYGKVLELCRKDFRNFRKENGKRLVEDMSLKPQQVSFKRINRTEINEEQRSFEDIRVLLKEGRDDIAFSLFFRTFPSCLPHRSRDNIF